MNNNLEIDNLEIDNLFSDFKNPYDENSKYVGNLNTNKYFEERNKNLNDARTLNNISNIQNTIATLHKNSNSSGENVNINKTFEMDLNNPYSNRTQKNNDVNVNPSSVLLNQMNELSLQLSNYSNITSNVEGINKKKEHEIVIKLEENKNKQEENEEIKPIAFAKPSGTTTFLANTLSLPPIDETQVVEEQQTTSFFAPSQTFFVDNEDDKKGNKALKISLWVVGSIAIALILAFLIFWILEFVGVTDLIWLKGFDPIN